MLINETKPGELDGMKEVKVKIPVRYHMILLSMKVLHGKQISDAVSEALEAYFAKMRDSLPVRADFPLSPRGLPATGAPSLAPAALAAPTADR